MLVSPIEDIRRANAEFARDVEYLKETALDDQLDDRIAIAESQFEAETIEELEEALELVKRLPDEEDVVEEKAEVDRILSADKNLTFDEMVGI